MSEQEKKKEVKMTKEQIAKRAMKVYEEMEESMKLENIVKDNTIEFIIGDREYRVKKPNLLKQQEIEQARRKKYTELMADDSFLFRQQWVDNYLKKGVDIIKMENELRVSHAEIKKSLIKLATTVDDKGIEDLKAEVNKTREEQYTLSIKITNMLSYCIESQLKIYEDTFTAAVVLEIKEGEEWKRNFESFEEFEETHDIELINKTFYYLQYLMYSDE